jgi:hypothetical protein
VKLDPKPMGFIGGFFEAEVICDDEREVPLFYIDI